MENKLIKELVSSKNIQAEYKYSEDTRFDFLCDNKLLEVKNVTLIRKNIAQFPDAITERGTKHLIKLKESIKKKFKPFVLFLTQIEDIDVFCIAKDIDKNYYKNYLIAKKAGVKFLAYKCIINSKEIKIKEKIKILNE